MSPNDLAMRCAPRGGAVVFTRTRFFEGGVSSWTRAASAAAQAMPPHDLEQTGMVGQPELLRRFRDVPLVALERGDDDLPLRFRFALEKRARFAGGPRQRRAFYDLCWHVVGA